MTAGRWPRGRKQGHLPNPWTELTGQRGTVLTKTRTTLSTQGMQGEGRDVVTLSSLRVSTDAKDSRLKLQVGSMPTWEPSALTGQQKLAEREVPRE